MLPIIETALAEQPRFAHIWHAVAASVLVDCGDLKAAREHFDQAAATDFSATNGDRTWFPSRLNGLNMASWAAASLGDVARAADLYPRLLPFSGWLVFVRVYVEMPFDFCLGLLATVLERYDDAERHLAACEELCTRLRAPTFIARTHLQRARLCRARGAAGDDQRARGLARSVVTDAELLGMARVAEDARSLLHALSAPDGSDMAEGASDTTWIRP